MTSTAIAVAAALGCATVGGVLFAFSAFVMPGLRRLAPAEGIAAMQAINVAAVTPVFMTALLGTAGLCLLTAARAVRDWGDRRATLLAVGSGLYLLGALLLTIVHHVPLNDALAGVDPHGAGAARRWEGYLAAWTGWNHVRAAAALGAALAFMLAEGRSAGA